MLKRLMTMVATCCAVGSLVGVAPTSVAAHRAPGADLAVERLDPDAAPAGGLTSVHAIVVNTGTAKAGAFTVTITLPRQVTAEGRFFPASCAVSGDGSTVRCPFRAGLAPERSATARIPVRLDRDATGTLTGGRVAVSSEGDPTPDDDAAPFTVTVQR
ncbi:hypothetical protein GCM10009665_22720 [Kitasatospora nipponensis]|uniref:Repeat protein (TIGR01451 family) n=1 Tax=Kitasatospora nipponensis TaxID=258049 RepID=A0ABN1W651_9ACTN